MAQHDEPLCARELVFLMRMCEEAGPMQRGTPTSEQRTFYAEARRWLPTLVAHYLRSERDRRSPHASRAHPSEVKRGP